MVVPFSLGCLSPLRPFRSCNHWELDTPSLQSLISWHGTCFLCSTKPLQCYSYFALSFFHFLFSTLYFCGKIHCCATFYLYDSLCKSFPDSIYMDICQPAKGNYSNAISSLPTSVIHHFRISATITVNFTQLLNCWYNVN